MTQHYVPDGNKNKPRSFVWITLVVLIVLFGAAVFFWPSDAEGNAQLPSASSETI